MREGVTISNYGETSRPWLCPHRRCVAIRMLVSCCVGLLCIGDMGCWNREGSISTPSHEHVTHRMARQAWVPQVPPKPVEKGVEPLGFLPRPGQEFAYAASGNDILQFWVGSAGRLSLLSPATARVGQQVKQLVADPRGRYVYVACFNDHKVSQIRIKSDGTLELPPISSALVSGEVTDLAASPDGRFLYATTDNGTIDQFDVRTTAGLRSHSRVSPLNSGAQPSVAIEPKGRFLYYGHNGSLGQMCIRPDGTLKPLSPSDADSGTFYNIAPFPDGKFVYAVAYASSGGPGAIREYRINANGTLRLLTHDYVPLGANLLTPHPRNRYLYASGFYGREAIQIFRVLPSGTLKKVSSVMAGSTAHSSSWIHASISFSLDPTGQFAWVVRNDLTIYPPPATQVFQYRIGTAGALARSSPFIFSNHRVFEAPVVVRH